MEACGDKAGVRIQAGQVLFPYGEQGPAVSRLQDFAYLGKKGLFGFGVSGVKGQDFFKLVED